MKGYILVLAALLLAFANAEEKCCVECTNENEQKFYSIDTLFDRCGECCFNPKKYWLYRIFEFGLKEAEVDHPCQEAGYTEYEVTETHGAIGIKMTLDKYKKPTN